MLEVDTLVVGAGPVGAITARSLSGGERVAIAVRASRHPLFPVLELIPPATVQLLLETWKCAAGIVPAQERLVAWDKAEPREVSGSAFVVDRGALDAWILARTLEAGNMAIVCDAGMVRAKRTIEARGRAAIASVSRRTIRHPWVARSVFAPRSSRQLTGIRVASLPSGYAVRHVGDRHTVISFVGPAAARLSVNDWLCEIQKSAAFLLEGLGSHTRLERGGARRASMEVSAYGDAVHRVGDAAFARDALSSQGLATGLSDGLRFAAVEDERGATAVRLRRAEELCTHVEALRSAARASRFSNSDAWTAFAADLDHFNAGDHS